jgi:hypothetical protein
MHSDDMTITTFILYSISLLLSTRWNPVAPHEDDHSSQILDFLASKTHQDFNTLCRTFGGRVVNQYMCAQPMWINMKWIYHDQARPSQNVQKHYQCIVCLETKKVEYSKYNNFYWPLSIYSWRGTSIVFFQILMKCVSNIVKEYVQSQHGAIHLVRTH